MNVHIFYVRASPTLFPSSQSWRVTSMLNRIHHRRKKGLTLRTGSVMMALRGVFTGRVTSTLCLTTAKCRTWNYIRPPVIDNFV